jgi:hypothetical protein
MVLVLSATHKQTFAASSLFTYSDPPLNSAPAQYDFWNSGTGGGRFILNGVVLAIGQDNIIPADQLSQLVYEAGSGTDTISIRGNDGIAWGAWSDPFNVTVPGAVDTGPVVTAPSYNLATGHGLGTIHVWPGVMFNTSLDTFNDAVTQYDYWDAGTGGGHLVLNGQALGTNQDNYIPASQIGQLDYWAASGADTIWVRAFDGLVWGPWSKAFTLTGDQDSGPVETVSPKSATHGQTFAGSSLFTYSDPLGLAAVQYGLWNAGTGGGHFLFNGTLLVPGQDNIISASQLSQLVYKADSGTDTLWIRAYDGTVWGAWSNPFNVTVPGAVDNGPLINSLASSYSTGHGLGSLPVVPGVMFSVSPDAYNDAVTQYDYWDTGTGGSHLVFNGQALGANQDNYIAALQLGQLSYWAGAGSDTMWVRAFDGMVWGPWSQAFTLTGDPDPGPTVTVSDKQATHGQTFAASTLFTYNDPFGDPATQYDFWDAGTGGGSFGISGINKHKLVAGQDNYVAASQLSQLSYIADSGTDTIWVRANDGAEWSSWSKFTVTVPGPLDTGPVVGVAGGGDWDLDPGDEFSVKLWFTASTDQFNDPITFYDVWNLGSGGGQLRYFNGSGPEISLGANQENVVSAAEFNNSDIEYKAGSGGVDKLWVRAFDGVEWGPWSDPVTVTSSVDTGPVITLPPLPSLTVHDFTTATPGQTIALSNLVTIADPGHVGYQKLELWDSFGTAATGQFKVNGVAQTGGHEIDVSPANVASVVFAEGTIGNTDTLWAQLMLNDGTTTGWQKFTVVDPVTIEQGATLELTNAYAGHAIFAGNAGTLQLDDSVDFTGTVAGMTGADTLDLRDIGFSPRGTRLGYSANADDSGGTLSISDGTHTAQIILLGQYAANSFAAQSDGGGGTLVQLHPQPVAMLTQPQQA